MNATTMRSGAVILLLFVLHLPLAGQEGSDSRPRVSPELPADHWAVVAARRAEALGLLSAYLPAQRSVPRHVVRRALEEADTRAREHAAALAALTGGWVERFEEEFPATALAAGGPDVHSMGNSAILRGQGDRGAAAPGVGVFAGARTGATPSEDRTAVSAGASIAVRWTRHLSALAEPEISSDRVALPSWDLGVGAGSFALAVGRQPVGYGYAAPGGLVMAGVEAIERVQLSTVDPVRLPGVFRSLGSISLHAFGGRLEEPRHPGNPVLWGIAGAIQPHPRATFSLHRAGIIAGDSVATPLTLRNFLLTFTGQNLLGFENEVVALQVRVRLPTEALLPLTVYGEWGAEDAAGAWRDVPGRLVGILVPGLPGLPEVSLGAEYVAFAPSCCGNPPWYRHAPHTGGWVVDERPMGHPLGGEGREASASAQADLWASKLRLDGRLAARSRAGENLYVPGREGRSTAFDLRAALRVAPRIDTSASLSIEEGSGWNQRAAAVGVRAFF